MMKLWTVIGEIDLWDNKTPEIVNWNFDEVKNKITLTFLLRNSEGQDYSVDKLKMYGVRNCDKAIRTFELVKKAVQLIDLRKIDEVRLYDKQGVLLQVIECDKYEYKQKRVGTT